MSQGAQSNQRQMSVLELLGTSTEFLRERGVQEPRLDAELLIGEVLGLDRLGLYLQHDRQVETAERDRFRELIRRRLSGEPVAYILGRKEFYGLEFEVGPAVLVPRPETEVLVDCLLKLLAEQKLERPLIAEVGAGSGAICVSLAHSLPGAQLVATEISPEALEFASRNAVRHNVAEHIELLQSDVLERVAGPLDAVISNPPYIAEHELAALPADVRDHEPHAALIAGPDGLELIQRLVEQAAPLLRPGGVLCFEIGAGQLDRVTGIITGHGGYDAPRAAKDLAGHHRVVIAHREN
ncbi:MAG: peptide chain release factor N(5)-glutamine methyltransferase [Candidatus Alcyoniella australis]|nr:peptide chain release factor N(5)-glutamine methyltransferase [Candidatus Alcyoniella australis]